MTSSEDSKKAIRRHELFGMRATEKLGKAGTKVREVPLTDIRLTAAAGMVYIMGRWGLL